MDPVSIAGLIGVATLFLSGLGLVVVGLTRQANRLPDGSEELFAAIADGCLGGLPDVVANHATFLDDDHQSTDPTGPIPVVPERTAISQPIWADDYLDEDSPVVPVRARTPKSSAA